VALLFLFCSPFSFFLFFFCSFFPHPFQTHSMTNVSLRSTPTVTVVSPPTRTAPPLPDLFPMPGRPHSMTNVSWTPELPPIWYTANEDGGLVFSNMHTLFGATVAGTRGGPMQRPHLPTPAPPACPGAPPHHVLSLGSPSSPGEPQCPLLL